TTTVGWLPNIPALNVHPTIETSVAQAILTLGMTATAVYTFLIAPAMARRRMRPQNSHAPHPALSQDPAERILKS
ncbi:MAG: hypothetical protein KGL74_05200, partial [Elusimicrobia bacterium]|nr:hypothetical protein [Elusimicrobiota bacterium]